MRLVSRICAVILSFSACGIAAAKDADVDISDLSVRAIEHNKQEVFPTLMRFIEAREALASKDYEKAYELYSVLEIYDPNLEGVTEGLAKSLLGLGRPDLAKEKLVMASSLSEEMTIILTLSNAISLPNNQAEVYLRDRLRDTPDSRLWNLLGLKLADSGKAALSEQAYHQAETLGQSGGILQNNLGVLALKTGDFQSAVKYFSEGQKLASENLKFDNNHRLALLLDQQYLEAFDNLSRERMAPLLRDAALVAKNTKRPHLANVLRLKAQELELTYVP